MQVCTMACGNTEVIASGKPLSPSTTAMRMSLTPWALSSLTTLSQNLAPSVCSIQSPSTSFSPSAVAGIIASGFGHSGQHLGTKGLSPLYPALPANATFDDLLLACDRDLADQARRQRWLVCGSALHSDNYPRKPRGRLRKLPPEHDLRLSLCCARHGCRKRKTPPSLRFLGRKVYLAATIILIAILREGATQARMRRLTALINVDRRTVERWRAWWREAFTATPFWRIARASFMPPVDEDYLPATMLERFSGKSLSERMIALLRFLGPITGGQMQAL